MAQIRDRLVESREESGAPRFAPAGQSTQLIVGATAATDATLLAAASDLYRRHLLRRVYYSAFSPIPGADSRLPAAAPPLVREHRLYQSDWLMRYYGFEAAELTTESEPNLDPHQDPKLGWALRHRAFFPVDVNRAPREALLRVPGLGHRTVRRLLRIRRLHRLTLRDLARLGVVLRRARPFMIASDHDPQALAIDRADLGMRVRPPARQLALFEAATSAHTGEL